MELGETMEDFCETTGIWRSVIYSWLGRGSRLQDNKPLAKSYPTKIGEAKRAEVVVKYTDNHGIMGSWEVARHIGGISASKTAEIIRDIRPYILARQKMLREAFRKNSYEFLKPHACWSWDFMNVQVGADKLQLQTLVDECSRYILGWVLTAGVNFWQFRGLVCQAIKRYGVTPLVLKHDNDIILRGAGDFLAAKRIVDLPSPTYYPRFQARMERGNLDVRNNLAWYEDNACLTYSEMCERIHRVVTILRDVKPREMFDGKVCADILRNSTPITEISPEELISRIQEREQGWKALFAGKKGLKKMHRYAVIEEMKESNLLTVEMKHWQEFAGKIKYN
jgi:transposase InsO family protein